MQKARCTISCLWVALLCCAAQAGWLDKQFASKGYAEGGAAWLAMPVHAHAAALSGAVTAWSENLAGLQYNPAVLDAADTSTFTVNGTFTFMRLDRKNYGVDVTKDIGSYLVAGVSFSGFGMGGFEERDESGVPGSSFGYSTGAAAVAVAGRLEIPLSLGVRIRYLFEDLYDERANGFGVDLGGVYRPHEFVRVGLSVRNIASWLWWSTGRRDPVLAEGRVGVAGVLLDGALTAELDLEKTIRQPMAGAVAIEYTLLEMASVRGGLRSAVDFGDRKLLSPDYSVGVGMRYSFFGFDYALIVPSSELGLQHKLSVVGKIPTFR